MNKYRLLSLLLLLSLSLCLVACGGEDPDLTGLYRWTRTTAGEGDQTGELTPEEAGYENQLAVYSDRTALIVNFVGDKLESAYTYTWTQEGNTLTLKDTEGYKTYLTYEGNGLVIERATGGAVAKWEYTKLFTDPSGADTAVTGKYQWTHSTFSTGETESPADTGFDLYIELKPNGLALSTHTENGNTTPTAYLWFLFGDTVVLYRGEIATYMTYTAPRDLVYHAVYTNYIYDQYFEKV